MRSSAHCPVTQASCHFEHRTRRALIRKPLLPCDRQKRFGPRGHQLGFPPLDPEHSLEPQSEAQAERMSHSLAHREGGEPPLRRAIRIAEAPQGQRLLSQGPHGRIYHENLWPAALSQPKRLLDAFHVVKGSGFLRGPDLNPPEVAALR